MTVEPELIQKLGFGSSQKKLSGSRCKMYSFDEKTPEYAFINNIFDVIQDIFEHSFAKDPFVNIFAQIFTIFRGWFQQF